MAEIYIGLMSGTSMDGVDGVLVEWMPDAALHVHAHVHLGFEPALAAELMALNSIGPDELHRAALAGNALARRYADVVHALLAKSGMTSRPCALWVRMARPCGTAPSSSMVSATRCRSTARRCWPS